MNKPIKLESHANGIANGTACTAMLKRTVRQLNDCTHDPRLRQGSRWLLPVFTRALRLRAIATKSN